VFKSQRAFNGNLDTESTVSAFSYASNLLTKVLTLIFVCLLIRLFPENGVFAGHCFGSYLIVRVVLYTLMLGSFIPLMESVIALKNDSLTYSWIMCVFFVSHLSFSLDLLSFLSIQGLTHLFAVISSWYF